MPAPRVGSRVRSRTSSTQAPTQPKNTREIIMPMAENTAPSKAVEELKWLVVPRTTCRSISTSSPVRQIAVTQPITRTTTRCPDTKDSNQAKVSE